MRALRRGRALARVECRQLARAKARSLLIAALIGLPVAALVGGGVLLQITVPTPHERALRLIGAGDLRVDGDGPAIDRALDALPATTVIDTFTVAPERIEVGGLGLAALRWSYAPDSFVAARFRIVDGRTPREPDEVAVSRFLADAAGIALGDLVQLGSDARRANVVGIVVDPEDLDAALVTVAERRAPSPGVRRSRLLGLADDSAVAPVAAALRDAGASVTTAQEIRSMRLPLAQVIFVLGSLGFVEAALVVAAAFAIGLRRRQREVGLLGATGANRGDIVGSILVSAAVLATIGSGLGIAVGLGAAALLHPYLDAWNGRWNGPFEVPVVQLAGAAVLGVVTAVAAAAWPARGAARLPIRVALSGRRPPVRRAGSWLLGGCVMVAIGLLLSIAAPYVGDAAMAAATIGGAVFGVLGFGACSPWLLERFALGAARLPLAWRLAVRDAGRYRSRNGPVVTAVLAGMAVSVTIAALIASVESTFGDTDSVTLRDDHLRVRGPAAAQVGARIAELLAAHPAVPLQAAMVEGEPIRGRFAGHNDGGWVAVGDAALLRALGSDTSGSVAPLTAIAAATQGRTVELTTRRDWRILAACEAADIAPGTRLRNPAFVLSSVECERRGFAVGPPPNRSTTPWLVRLRQPVTEDALRRARAVAAQSAGTTIAAAITHRRLPRLLYRIVLGLSLLTGLLVIGVATALTAVESRADRRTLVTVGATPRLSRAHAAARAAFLALLGCALAVPAGLLPAVGAISTISELPFVVPWFEILLTTVGLPVLAYAGAWLMTRPVVDLRSA